MVVDEFNLNIDEIIKNEKSFIKEHNNIYISEEQINILKKYNIDIERYVNVNELIYDIEESYIVIKLVFQQLLLILQL